MYLLLIVDEQVKLYLCLPFIPPLKGNVMYNVFLVAVLMVPDWSINTLKHHNPNSMVYAKNKNRMFRIFLVILNNHLFMVTKHQTWRIINLQRVRTRIHGTQTYSIQHTSFVLKYQHIAIWHIWFHFRFLWSKHKFHSCRWRTLTIS